ncbi:MAG TPA: metallophosphoesterase family protein [Solirubrobacteraceae bacterium]|nr:metallophosphoesterase family protein [Solirubrobacteraceae bacterium]
MSIAIVSDVHGNRHAFQAVLESIAAAGCERIWCLGDLVGYGADPDACVELARDHAELCLAGNHDLAVTGAIDASEFSAWALTATTWTQATIRPDTRGFLEGLTPSERRDGVALYHASPRDPVWEYVLSTDQAARCLEVQDERIALIGHSHVALSFSRADHGATTGAPRLDGERVEVATGAWLLNPGSVGQPRDGDPRAAWMELDLAGGEARFHRVDYDIEGAGAAIRAAGLPEGLAERLRYGQ